MLKPLLVYPEGNKFVTLGGNFRLRALEELGETEVEIKITHPKTEADKIRLALIDNDRAGETDDQKQAELIFPYVKEINLEDYNIDRGESTKLSKMMEDYVPGEVEEQKRLEAIAQKEQVKCPECGCEFIP